MDELDMLKRGVLAHLSPQSINVNITVKGFLPLHRTFLPFLSLTAVVALFSYQKCDLWSTAFLHPHWLEKPGILVWRFILFFLKQRLIYFFSRSISFLWEIRQRQFSSFCTTLVCHFIWLFPQLIQYLMSYLTRIPSSLWTWQHLVDPEWACWKDSGFYSLLLFLCLSSLQQLYLDWFREGCI